MAKRRCKGKTKAGRRCRAYPLGGSEFCSAHDPLRPAETRFGDPVQAAAAGSVGGTAGKRPRAVDVMRERLEQQMDAVLAPYFSAISEAVVVVKYEGNAIASNVPDLEARQRAAERVLDRVYGKPSQTIAHTGVEDGPPIALELDASVADAAHEFLNRVRQQRDNA